MQAIPDEEAAYRLALTMLFSDEKCRYYLFYTSSVSLLVDWLRLPPKHDKVVQNVYSSNAI